MSTIMSPEIEVYLERIDGKLTALLNQPKKETWVSVQIIQDLTGWTEHWLRKARRNALVKARRRGNSMEYLLESVHPLFIKKNQ